MANLDNILSPVWTIGLDGGGTIAEGLEAIKQCLSVIVRTTPGTDPLRPEFGCDLYKYVDHPLKSAIPNMKHAMLLAVRRWEPRVSVTKISHTVGDNGRLFFYLGYSLADGSAIDSLTISVNSGGANTGVPRQRLVIRAPFPTNSTGLQLQISGQLNGIDMLPDPPVGGFASASELYAWVQTNWVNYGQWYQTADDIVGYIKPQYQSGSVGISVIPVRRIAASIPGGFAFTVNVSVGGTTYISTIDITTPGGILGYLLTDPVLSQLGTWSIVDDFIGSGPDFNDDFDEDYFTFNRSVQLITDSTDEINITVTAS